MKQKKGAKKAPLLTISVDMYYGFKVKVT